VVCFKFLQPKVLEALGWLAPALHNEPNSYALFTQGLSQHTVNNLSQASAQRHRKYFLLNNKAVKVHGADYSV